MHAEKELLALGENLYRLRAIVLYRASRHFRISVETLLTSLSD